MKTSKKILALVLAFALVLAIGVTAYAAVNIQKVDGVTGPASITVQLPTTPEGYTADNEYKIYKVFDAALAASGTGISYTLSGDHTTVPDGFQLDDAGNVKYVRSENADVLTQADIDAIKAYVNAGDLVATVTTQAGDTSFTVTDLPYGYYFITTTTGTVVTVDSTKPNAEVNDKNELPPVEKLITDANSYDDDGKKALAEVGSVVEFTATIVTKAGAENYEFHDTMTAGLQYNSDLKVYVGGVETAGGASTFTVGANQGETLSVKFDNTYIAGLAENTEIKFVYTATVTSDALTRDPAKNTCYLSYGHNPGDNRTPIQETEVYNAKISVKKQDDKEQPLKDAGFVLQNSDGAYYKNVNGVVSWVTDIDDADEHFSDAEGNVPAFTGLANGTYTLVEKTVPSGYNKGTDQTFTIKEHDYTVPNLEQEATVINKEGPSLPSTGGIGTTIFYVVGAVLVLGAAIVLIARRRASVNA